MSIPAVAEPLPLEMDPQGVVRVGGTRVTLDTVVAAFDQGATAEEIQQRYPSLQLADIYATISYYLHQREWVASYLEKREQKAAEVRAEIEARFDTTELRKRLLARRQ